jgi:hypothetical protein
MSSFSRQFAAIGARIAPHPVMPIAIPAHHATNVLGVGVLVVVVMLAVLIGALGRIAREVVSLYAQLMNVLAPVTANGGPAAPPILRR